MRELQGGLWWWEALHPHWTPAADILETMQPLLELPVELVLPTHGVPADRVALERALS